LIDGSIARGISAYAGDGVYLDVALGWLTDRVATCKVSNELEMRNKSGYSLKKLLSHFLRLILSGGTRPLRIVTISGISIAVSGIGYAGYVVVGVLLNGEPVAGWTSVIVSILLIGGLVLISLGVIAEYIGLAVRAAFGKPSYFVRQNRKFIADQFDSSN
jgi:undecaprenyl-phosphate 4-deoxy-4-formamido-L-arabinose transferase